MTFKIVHKSGNVVREWKEEKLKEVFRTQILQRLRGLLEGPELHIKYPLVRRSKMVLRDALICEKTEKSIFDEAFSEVILRFKQEILADWEAKKGNPRLEFCDDCDQKQGNIGEEICQRGATILHYKDLVYSLECPALISREMENIPWWAMEVSHA